MWWINLFLFVIVCIVLAFFIYVKYSNVHRAHQKHGNQFTYQAQKQTNQQHLQRSRFYQPPCVKVFNHENQFNPNIRRKQRLFQTKTGPQLFWVDQHNLPVMAIPAIQANS